MKVKCIDAPATGELELGKIYQVRGEHSEKKDWYLAGVELSWNKKRFEIVDYEGEEDAAPPPPATLIDFFKAVPDGHCPCNIPKAQCGYHKA